MDYTTDHEAIAEKIRQSKADGGEDDPEDLKGALDEAYKLSHKAPLLHIILICDAPTHGKQYHDLSDDDYPNQPEGSLEDSLKKFKELKDT